LTEGEDEEIQLTRDGVALIEEEAEEAQSTWNAVRTHILAFVVVTVVEGLTEVGGGETPVLPENQAGQCHMLK
jgi:hypothetical protein